MKKVLISLLICFNVDAQNIDFVVPSAPGGPTDIATRNVISKLSSTPNLKFNILYKPGAAQSIAFQYVEQSTNPTLIIATNAIIDDNLYKTAEQVYHLGSFSNIFLTNSNSNLKNLNDLDKLSKIRPINFGHGGVGTSSYHAMMKFCDKHDCIAVPYKGTSQGMVDILNGSIDVYAPVSFGITNFLDNNYYKSIGKVYINDNWVILFGKNLSLDNVKSIRKILGSVDNKFFKDMGLE